MIGESLGLFRLSLVMLLSSFGFLQGLGFRVEGLGLKV